MENKTTAARVAQVYRSNTATAKKRNGPSLLDLPAELRDIIYHLVLTISNIPDFLPPTPWSQPYYTSLYPVNVAPTQPALLTVNRQIRDEAMPIFDENEFVLMIQDQKFLHPGHWRWLRTKLSFGPRNWGPLYEDDDLGHEEWSGAEMVVRKYHRRDLLLRYDSPELDGAESMVAYMGDWRHDAALAYAFRVIDILAEDSWKKVEGVLKGLMEGYKGWDVRDAQDEE